MEKLVLKILQNSNIFLIIPIEQQDIIPQFPLKIYHKVRITSMNCLSNYNRDVFFYT
jgi:hypothetical protein